MGGHNVTLNLFTTSSNQRIFNKVVMDFRSMGRTAAAAEDVLQDIRDGDDANQVVVVVNDEEAVHLVGMHLGDHLTDSFGVHTGYRTERLLQEH